jgi:chromosome segregation ATPase
MSSAAPKRETTTIKADDAELQAVKKELAELMAQIAVKEKELAELKRKTVPLRGKIAEAKWAQTVEVAIEEARLQYPRNPKGALHQLGETVAEVWDNAEIGEDARAALLDRLLTARRELVKEKK